LSNRYHWVKRDAKADAKAMATLARADVARAENAHLCVVVADGGLLQLGLSVETDDSGLEREPNLGRTPDG
jgi:hypothetical protein